MTTSTNTLTEPRMYAPPVSFGRLVCVEIRKLTDTRSSRAILIFLALFAVAALTWLTIFNVKSDAPVTLPGAAISMTLFSSLAMPIIGVLGMTSDVVHRTTYVYFPLVRGRSGMFWAKVVGAAIVSVSLQLFITGLSAAVTLWFAVSSGSWDGFNDSWSVIADSIEICLLSTLFGVAIAAAVRNTALSIVAIILLTLLVNTLVIFRFPEFANYVITVTPVTAALGGEGAPATLEVLSSLGIWYVMPLLLGWLLTVRREG